MKRLVHHTHKLNDREINEGGVLARSLQATMVIFSARSSFERNEAKHENESSSFSIAAVSATRHGTDDVRVTRVGDSQCAHAEVFTTSRAQLDIVAGVMVNAGLGEHGVVLGLGFPVEGTGKLVSECN